ncbi:hypothetical protein ACIRG5_25875 [Lentzea sp. NPDC102401]|uniref:hypothetical protein n=1 Tax=Lentzea sp. NPDC102401 TaxID=3364128 RepID=UPI00382AAFFD
MVGREFVHGYVVTEHEPDRLVEMKVDRPFPMTVRHELDGTLVAIRASGSPGRFFGWAKLGRVVPHLPDGHPSIPLAGDPDDAERELLAPGLDDRTVLTRALSKPVHRPLRE